MIAELFHSLFTTWFRWVESGGYTAVFFLMAMESSIFPVPSEVVIPPAAYLASQGKLDFWLVVVAGTLGSYAGSIATYYVSKALGIPFLKRYGKYVFLHWDKIEKLIPQTKKHGNWLIFGCRFLPVVRHFISIPAGVLGQPVLGFSVATTLGAFGWCTILALLGEKILGAHPELLASPVAMISAIKHTLPAVTIATLVLFALYFGVQKILLKKTRA